MNTRRITRRLAVSALLSACAFAGTAPAFADEAWPSRPIKIVVPTGAGGITDILARYVGEQLGKRLQQPVIIDNRAGAAGILGSDAVAKSAPDGYTLLMVFPSHTVNPSLYAKLPYDTLKDFTGVSSVSSVSLVLLTNPASGINSVQQLIAAARQKPGAINFGSVGNGSLGHLGAELFASSANIKMTHIPYKGVPQVLTDLMSGEINIYFDTPVTAVGHVKSGKLKALGVSTPARNPSLPDVPTIAESGVSGFEVTSWNGLLAPAGTPAPIVTRLNQEVVAILNEPDTKAKFRSLGVEPLSSTPQALNALVKADLERWARVLKAANIKPE